MLFLWILVTIFISFVILKTMHRIPEGVTTDWLANIITMVVGLTTAVLMAGTIVVSASMSSKQITEMQNQISQLESFKQKENLEKDKKALFEIEHYFKSYEDTFYDIGRAIAFLDKYLDTKNAPLLRQIKTKDWKDDTPILTEYQREALARLTNDILSTRYELPDKPDGLERLPSSFSRAYQGLVRLDRSQAINLRNLSGEIKTTYDSYRYYRTLESFQSKISNIFGGLSYEMECYNRRLNNLKPSASREEWLQGIFRIKHPNRLALETVRYPRMRVWAEEQLEYRKYNFAEEQVKYVYEIIEGSEDDFDVKEMKSRLGKAMSYILHYHKGVTEFKQRMPAPQNWDKLEYTWR
jgi:uncharacterized membrane-anchored protein YhcB (DUF1043 family)